MVDPPTAYQWVKHLPLDRDSPRARERGQQAQALRNLKSAERRAAREAKEADLRRRAAAWAGGTDLRELLLIGAAIYWCEGAKGRPYRKQYDLQFINSDLRLVELFLRFLEATGRDRCELRYRLSIHETADVDGAVRWWGEQLRVEARCFQRTVIKRHNPLTNRVHTGADYRGCLIVRVPRARELYLWIEGVMEGLLRGVPPTGFATEAPTS
ncbi:MAG TPA: resolvase [Micromonospora sp.]|nr:resolvase [Micromonospora sp.]